jgi:Ca2+-binding RTX toxin-like protein
VAGSTFTLPGGVTPTTVGVTDNDTLFTDGDNGQQLVEGVTLNGTFVPAGETLEIEYSYSVQDSSGNVINIFAVEQSSSSVVGFISDQPLTLDETYTFIERTSTNPEIPYGNIATAYFDPAAVVAPPTGVGDDAVGGADVITGGDGADSLFGGAGADSLSGGDGNDLIEGGDTAGSFVYVQSFDDGTLNGWQLDDVGDGTLTASATAGVGGTGGLVFDDAQGDQEFLRAPQEFLDALPGSGDLTAATLSFDLRYSSETAFTPVNSIVITGDGQTITLPYTLASGQAGQFQTVTVDLLDAAAAGVTEARLQEILANITDLQIAIDVNVGFPAGDEVFIDNITLAATTAQDDNDTLLGGAGADTLLGEAGDDSLSGDAGSDSLSGGDGDDLLSGGADADILEGGQGSDTFLLSDGFGNDTITGGEDVDGLDVDVIDASGVTTGGVTVSVTDEAGSVLLGSDSVAFSDIESFTLTDQADSFTAFGNSAVTVDGGDGDDTIREGNGDNLVDGGAGSDRFIIGFGTSTIIGGEDGDGSDRDILSAFEANDGVSVIFDGTEQGSYTDNSDSDSGTFSEIEGVNGSNQADTIDASLDNSAGLTLSGAGGDDSVVGGSGEDFISGGAGADTLTGGAGGDALVGDEGDDVIDGGAGADFIEGGAGNDLLTGGDGDDFFSYLVGDGLDTITDFNTGNTGTLNDNDSSNNDFIDLSAFFDNIAELQDDYDDDGVLNQSNAGNIVWGQVVDYSDNTSFDTDGIEGNEGIVFDGGVPDGSFFTVENTGVICFA